MGGYVEISKGQNGTTKVSYNGYDLSPYITKFSLSQRPKECIPTLTIEIPATSIQMPDDFWAALEIKRKGEN